MDAIQFLGKSTKTKRQPIFVLNGDEDFLKRQVLAALRALVLGAGDDGFGLSVHAGDKATFAAVRDEVETLPLLGPRRLVVVDRADPFVSRYRAQLERYVEAPGGAGVLVLDVASWPANTRLAKALPDAASAASGLRWVKPLVNPKLPKDEVGKS